MERFDHFTVPVDWGRRYTKLAKPVPYCVIYPTIDLARNLVTRIIDPVLADVVGRVAADASRPGCSPRRPSERPRVP